MKTESYPPRPTHLLHLLLKEKISPGDTVIDATAGNGHDTLFLAEAVEETGRVIAIDIQEQAINSTRTRLEAADLASRATFHQTSHTEISKIASGVTPTAILFNLGYLPGGDRSVITHTTDSLTAITASVEILAPKGLLAVMCYPGHSGGDEEAAAVYDFISSRSDLRTARYGLIGTRDPAPFLLLSEKHT
ncbi:MAG: class I SAM-dependent methyltransferase [Luteolibacter sp.]